MATAPGPVRDLLTLTETVLAGTPSRAALLVLDDAWTRLAAWSETMAASATTQLADTGNRADDDATVHRLIAAGGVALAALVAAYRAGRLSRTQFITQATARLTRHAVTAGRLGAAQTGAAADFDRDSLAVLGERASDLADAAADRGYSDAQVLAWGAALAGLCWTAYQRGRRDGGKAAGVTLWNRRCKDDDASCQRCVEIADGSPYSAEDADAIDDPGVFVTPCQANCRCWWEQAEEAD